MSDPEIIEFNIAKQPHAEARRENRVAAMREAFKAVREEHQPAKASSKTAGKKKSGKKKRGGKKK